MIAVLAIVACARTEQEQDARDADRDGDGFTAAQGDCDDDDPSVNPGADESCDGADDDCDGEIDEEGADAATWFADADGDNSAGISVAGAGDVDGDGLADLLIGAYHNSAGGVYAGAAYLVLGSAEPANAPLADADARYLGESAEDKAGYHVSGAGDVDGDGLDDLLVGAHHLDAAGDMFGAAYLLLAPGW